MRKPSLRLPLMPCFLTLLAQTLHAQPPPVPKPSISIIIRPAANFPDLSAVKAFIKSAKANRVETLVVGVKQDEDDEYPSGTVFYRSTIAPMANPSFDVLKAVLAEAHSVGLKVHAWVPQFHDQVAFFKGGMMDNGYAWAMKAWVNGAVVDYTYTGSEALPPGRSCEFFVNPCSPEVQNYQRKILREIVQNYAVDGVVLDWLRFDHWNMDMGPTTLAAFKKLHPNIEPTQIDFSETNYQSNPALEAWQKWRCQQIGNHVRNVYQDIQTIRKNTPLGVFILPPEFDQCGQDLTTFRNFIHFVSPMCYFKDWKRPLEWIHTGVLQDVKAKAGLFKPIKPALDAPPSYTDTEYQTILTNLRTHHPTIKTVQYFCYGKWTEAQLKRISSIRHD